MKRTIILLALSAATVVANAQPSAQRLTLNKAIDLALENNHLLKSAQHDVAASTWRLRNAYTSFLPKVELSATYARLDDETVRRSNAPVDFIKQFPGLPPGIQSSIRPFAYNDTYEAGLTVIQPIYNGGMEFVSVQAAEADKEKSSYSYEDLRQDIITTTKITYYELLKAQELLRLAQESRDRTIRYVEKTKRQLEAGLRTNQDVLRWEVQLASDESNVINAENALALRKLQLNELMGVDLQREYVFDSPLENPLSPKTLPEPTLSTGQFVTEHPGYRVMESHLLLSEAAVNRAKTNFRPRMNIAFKYGWEKNNTLALDGIRPWTLAFTVAFPIFNSFSDYTNLQVATAQRRKTEELAESYKRGLVLQAQNASLNVRSSEKRIEIARKGFEQADENLAAVSRRYERGSASNVDFIDAQTAYTSARTNYINAVYDYSIAQIQLQRAVGNVSS